MSNPDKNQCFFRALYEEDRGGAESPPDFRGAELPGDQVCDAGSCTLRLGDLVEYVLAGGADAPRQRIDDQVDPSCSILDVTHQVDEDLMRAWDELGPPLDPPNRYQ